jgi:hypothetical protein
VSDITREQRDAREVISLYEGGERLAGIMDGSYLVLETWDGRIYRVDPDAEAIQIIEGGKVVRTTDWAQLDGESSPLWHPDPDDEPYDDGLYADPGIPGPVTDFHSDREADLRAEAKRVEDDKTYYRERGEAA